MSLVSAMKRSLTTAINSGPRLSWVRSGGLSQVRGFTLRSDMYTYVIEVEAQDLDMGAGRRVAYKKLHADKMPTIVMVPGLYPHTSMDCKKADGMITYCDMYDYSCVVYDNECTGQSSGDASKVMFSHWIEDALTVIDKLTDGPVVLIGSGVGGWLSLIAAQAIPPEKLHGLVLISPAVNHVWSNYNLDIGLKKHLAEDSLKHEINMNQTINIGCPVRIISSLNDKDISLKHHLELAASLKTKDVDFIYRKSSDHMLENIYDLDLILDTVNRMLLDYPARQTLTDEEKLKAEEKKEKVLHDDIMRKIAEWEF